MNVPYTVKLCTFSVGFKLRLLRYKITKKSINTGFLRVSSRGGSLGYKQAIKVVSGWGEQILLLVGVFLSSNDHTLVYRLI